MKTTHRAGFTALELVIVVLVIGLLVSMLLPAINNVRARAKEAAVSVEIKALETGLTQFHTEFGTYPPSRIVLHENPAGWAADSWSRNQMRLLFPQFDVSARHRVDPLDPSSTLLPGRDFNGDGDSDDTFILTGAECLVFWLAGPEVIRDGAPTGFSKNPRDPFEIDRGSRIGPFTEFDLGRWVDVDSDGVPEYRGDLTLETDTPYLYLSSYGGKGYKPSLDADVFLPHAPFTAMVPDTRPNLGIDSDGDGIVDTGRVYTQDQAALVPWKRDTYQIVSPGWDGQYGEGGYYRSDVEKLDMPEFDRDNITNFSRGLLAP